jgi:hypothetical protein
MIFSDDKTNSVDRRAHRPIFSRYYLMPGLNRSRTTARSHRFVDQLIDFSDWTRFRKWHIIRGDTDSNTLSVNKERLN